MNIFKPYPSSIGERCPFRNLADNARNRWESIFAECQITKKIPPHNVIPGGTISSDKVSKASQEHVLQDIRGLLSPSKPSNYRCF
jgi:hypothetical protein